MSVSGGIIQRVAEGGIPEEQTSYEIRTKAFLEGLECGHKPPVVENCELAGFFSNKER
jgi:hypothetical protein